MRNIHLLILTLAMAATALAGCEAGDSPETENATAKKTVAEDASTSTEDAPAAETATAPDASADSASAGLAVAQSQQYGAYLADSSGRALYLLEADSSGESRCYDACADAWPPFLAEQGSPAASDPGVQPDLIGTLQRRDGATQVTYNGHPLYYYAKDQGSGQATGQDVTDEWGEWYLVTLRGEPLEETPSGSPP